MATGSPDFSIDAIVRWCLFLFLEKSLFDIAKLILYGVIVVMPRWVYSIEPMIMNVSPTRSTVRSMSFILMFFSCRNMAP